MLQQLNEETLESTEKPKGMPSISSLRRLGDTLDEAFRRARNRQSGLEKPLPLPWPDMEPQFGGGLWPGCHVLVGGTGAGKSAWALQVALHAAMAGHPTGYVGLELEEMQIAMRLAGERAKVPWSSLYLGKATVPQIDEAHERATKELAKLPFYIEMGRASGWPASELARFAGQIREAHPEPKGPGSLPMFIVVDFLQIIGDEIPNGLFSGLELRERIGRAAYAAREATREYNAAVLLISSAARDKYGLLSGAAKESGFCIEPELDPKTAKAVVDSLARPIIKRRSIMNPDSLVGLGKESGEIEYAADSVTVSIRIQKVTADGKTPVIFATAKGRATGAGWCELRFNGSSFEESPSRGLDIIDSLSSEESIKRGGKANGENGPVTQKIESKPFARNVTAINMVGSIVQRSPNGPSQKDDNDGFESI
jgi:hypothetical protein